MKRKRDVFSKSAPGRKCSVCGRGGAVTRFLGKWAHEKCYRRFRSTLREER